MTYFCKLKSIIKEDKPKQTEILGVKKNYMLFILLNWNQELSQMIYTKPESENKSVLEI